MADATGKLPVFETVSKAFRYTAAHVVLMIKIAWPWLALTVAALLLFIFAFGAVGGMSSLSGNQGTMTSTIIVYVVTGAGYLAMLTAAMASIAVEWHRSLLLGEAVGWMHFRIRSRAFAYFGYFLAIGLISAPIIVVLMMTSDLFTVGATEASDGPPILRMLFVAGLVTLCWTLIFSRLFLVLPGAAVGDRRLSLRQSIALTSGNTLRIAGGFILLWLISLGVGLASLVLAAPIAGVPVVSTVFELVMFGLNVFLTFAGLSYMSFCYWFFVPAPQEGDLA